MKVFISWSGATSRLVAEALSVWMPKVIQGLEPFVSAKDIDKGANWTVELARELEDAEFGVICLAPDNLLSPWLNYEAGAITKSVNSRVCPILFEVERSQVKPPISQLQMTSTSTDDFLLLMASMNKVAGSPLTAEALKEALDVWWPRLKQDIDSIPRPQELTQTDSQDAGIDTAGLEPEKPSAELGEMISEVLHRMRSVDQRIEHLERQDRRLTGSKDRATTARREANGAKENEALSRLYSIAKSSGLLVTSAMGGPTSIDVNVDGVVPDPLPSELYASALESARDLNMRVRIVGSNRAAVFEKGGHSDEMPF